MRVPPPPGSKLERGTYHRPPFSSPMEQTPTTISPRSPPCFYFLSTCCHSCAQIFQTFHPLYLCVLHMIKGLPGNHSPHKSSSCSQQNSTSLNNSSMNSKQAASLSRNVHLFHAVASLPIFNSHLCNFVTWTSCPCTVSSRKYAPPFAHYFEGKVERGHLFKYYDD